MLCSKYHVGCCFVGLDFITGAEHGGLSVQLVPVAIGKLFL